MNLNELKVAQARLNKSGMRPLGRTQSAPLPLGHPLLQGAPGVVPGGVVPGVVVAGVGPAGGAGMAPIPITQQQFELYLRERQLYEQQQQHNMLIQVRHFSFISVFYQFFNLIIIINDNIVIIYNYK